MLRLFTAPLSIPQHREHARGTNGSAVPDVKEHLPATMRRILACMLLIFLWVPFSKAQNANSEQFPRFEIYGGYSSIETNDHTFRFGPHIIASNTDFDEGGHGFEAAFTRNLNRYVGIVGDFSAHFSYDQGTVNVTMPCPQPPCAPVPQSYSLDPRLFNFLAGPEIKGRNHTRFTPFAHALFGVAYATAAFKTAGPAVTLSRSDDDAGFAMKFGGGVEVRILRRMSFRTSFDYRKAYVGSTGLPPQRVNSVGFSAGIIFPLDTGASVN